MNVEAYRAKVFAGICPECGDGPFKALAMHTNQAHGIDRFELRRLAEIPRSTSIASPEYSLECSERAKEQGAASRLSAYVDTLRGGNTKRDLPDYSRRKISQTVRNTRANMGPAKRLAMDEARTRAAADPASRKKQGAALKEWHAANPMSEDRRVVVVARFNSPEAVAARELAIIKRRQPCGTAAAYKRGCRCEPCRDAKRRSRIAKPTKENQ